MSFFRWTMFYPGMSCSRLTDTQTGCISGNCCEHSFPHSRVHCILYLKVALDACKWLVPNEVNKTINTFSTFWGRENIFYYFQWSGQHLDLTVYGFDLFYFEATTLLTNRLIHNTRLNREGFIEVIAGFSRSMDCTYQRRALLVSAGRTVSVAGGSLDTLMWWAGLVSWLEPG